MQVDFRRNLALKFFSLVLALLVWILTTGESQKVKDLVVPLQYTHLPPGMALTGETPDKVSLRIQAPEPILQRISEDQVDARLDLSQLQMGDQYLTLSPDRFHVSGATVIRVEPPVLPLHLVRRSEKEVPIVPRLEGRPPEGYEVVDYRVDPATVTVVGPEDSVREVQRATTGSIFVGGFTTSREIKVHPYLEGEESGQVRLKEDSDRDVAVRVGIREKRIRRVLKGVPVRARGGGGPARVKPESIDVRVSGPASLVNALDRGNLLVEIHLEGLAAREKEYRLFPRVTLIGLPPGSSSDLQAEPASRTVSVKIAPPLAEKP
ncbi:MAG TPA: CdaR family protein [Candidatus Polarisedimenticolia bacterium]|jgi:YbbR domain-containing protein|nr:CdaR family protein [Candidatus Polarisedimenticolia bacterium]